MTHLHKIVILVVVAFCCGGLFASETTACTGFGVDDGTAFAGSQLQRVDASTEFFSLNMNMNTAPEQLKLWEIPKS